MKRFSVSALAAACQGIFTQKGQLIFLRVFRNLANFEETVDIARVETCQKFAHWAGQEKKDARKTRWPLVLADAGMCR